MSDRYRTRGALLPGANPWIDLVRWNECSGNWNTWTSVPWTTMVGEFETMSDTVTPRFRARTAKGELIFNPMRRTRQVSLPETGVGRWLRNKNPTISCSGSPQNWEHRSPSGMTAWICLSAFGHSGPYSGIPVPVGTVFSDEEVVAMQSEVSTRVMAQRGLSDSNLFESVAEINKLASAVTGPLQGFRSFLQQRTPKALAMGASGAWLAYRYGVRPFINDIESILKGLKKSVGKQRKTTRAFLSKERTESRVANSANYGDWYSKVQITTLDIVTCRAMSLDEYVADFSSNIGFTGKGLAGLPWELIPFSFVADWFVNVGDFLYAYIPAFGYNQLGSCLTTKRFRSSTYTILDAVEMAGSNWDMVQPPYGTLAGSVEVKTRSPLRDPKLSIKTNFRLEEITRMADAIALLFVVGAMAGRIFGGASGRPAGSSSSSTKVKRRG
jgi:hypothetical protein